MDQGPETRKPNRRARQRWLALPVAAVVLVGGFAYTSHRQATLEERERRELETRRESLRGQLAELTERRELLRELQDLSTNPGFYLITYAQSKEFHLRFQDRTLRRFWWTSASTSALSSPGLYSLQEVTPQALVWDRMAMVTGSATEPAACPAEAAHCLIITPEDMAVVSQTLKPGAPLLVFP
jgi:hypothetical protein